MLISIITLEAAAIRLVPIQPDMKAAMQLALDCDPEAWRVMGSSAFGDGFEEFWDKMLAEHPKGTRIAYAIVRRDHDQIIGTTSYLNLAVSDGGVEIGATFLNPNARAAITNPQAKLLMLEHAFACGALRVEFRVDQRNLRSQAAVTKLGAVREGVLRKHKITWTGHVRDTVMFSILDNEWPEVRARLIQRIEAI
jgi:RimJ/RimL family protein N-acetyltransferase